jgi:hypothetical protein
MFGKFIIYALRCVMVSKIIFTFGSLQELVNSLEKKTKDEIPAHFTENEVISKLTEEKEQYKV